MCDKGNEGKNRTEQNDVCRLFGIWLFSFWFFLSLYFHSQVVFFSVFILCFITLLFAVFLPGTCRVYSFQADIFFIWLKDLNKILPLITYLMHLNYSKFNIVLDLLL